MNTFVSPEVSKPSKIFSPPLPLAALTQAAAPVTVTCTLVPDVGTTGAEVDASGVPESVTRTLDDGDSDGGIVEGDSEGVGVGELDRVGAGLLVEPVTDEGVVLGNAAGLLELR